ncbi:MAG TPA: methyltransferase [Pseudobdellovibrionaceae bacterium]|jgi:23S rRNA (uracil1939-C5)-methyltransferase
MQIDCKYKKECSGCQYLDLSLQEQQHLKTQALSGLLRDFKIPFKSAINLTSLGPAWLRDRVDLVFNSVGTEGVLGLYKKNSREILDIEQCQQLSPQLQAWLSEIRKIHWPIRKGSLRLRVGPQRQKGIWLDFANIDIKNLLEEKTILSNLLNCAVVEIGQKHKVLQFVNGRLKLKDAEPQVWFQSFIETQAVDLFCSIGNFTQTGIQANRDLTKVISQWLEEIHSQHILEFGSGIGNLSFPALGYARKLTACEIDRGALAGFEKTLQKLSQVPGFEKIRERVEIQQGDFQNRNPQKFAEYDTVLVNPPRSGLKEFLNPLITETKKPKYFLYMSCFPESFVLDGQRLQQAGYSLQKLNIVDQFPQTTHYEILSLWGLNEEKKVSGHK